MAKVRLLDGSVAAGLRAEGHGDLRIVDESGEDYGYAADRFFALDVPKPLERPLLKAAS